MRPELVIAATEGLRVLARNKLKEEQLRVTQFWEAVARAERWLAMDLPRAIMDAIVSGRERIVYTDDPGSGSLGGATPTTFMMIQARGAGVLVEQEPTRDGRRTMSISIPASQFIAAGGVGS